MWCKKHSPFNGIGSSPPGQAIRQRVMAVGPKVLYGEGLTVDGHPFIVEQGNWSVQVKTFREACATADSLADSEQGDVLIKSDRMSNVLATEYGKGSLLLVDGGGTAHPHKPVTAGMVMIQDERVYGAWGAGFFPGPGMLVARRAIGDNYRVEVSSAAAEELALSFALSEIISDDKRNSRGMLRPDVALVVANLRWVDTLRGVADASSLVDTTRSLILDLLSQKEEVTILHRCNFLFLNKHDTTRRGG